MTEAGSAGILDRALANLRATWRGITVSDRAAKALPLRPGLPGDDADALRRQMRECLEGRGGEVSARARAAALGHAYLTLDKDGRRRFLTILAGEFGVDRDALRATARALADAEDPADVEALESDLRRVLTPPRLTLLTQFNSLPRGVKFLVDLRADLKDVAKGRAELRGLDDDLRGLLTSWFDVGFLDLRRITWDAPAALLEKLIAYEAVHEIRSWDDLKHRLDSDRRCYAYFHPSMPDEPLIFVQVA
ncbi:MAG: malonyl-CoA decarboxylase family protein, partial [Alphaproteobacteria bacterium]